MVSGYTPNLRRSNKMTLFTNALLEKWSAFGLFGTILTGLSIPIEGDGGVLTALSGVSVVIFSLWQKFREERRKEKRHNLQMEIIQKILKGEIEMDIELIREFIKEEG